MEEVTIDVQLSRMESLLTAKKVLDDAYENEAVHVVMIVLDGDSQELALHGFNVSPTMVSRLAFDAYQFVSERVIPDKVAAAH